MIVRVKIECALMEAEIDDVDEPVEPKAELKAETEAELKTEAEAEAATAVQLHPPGDAAAAAAAATATATKPPLSPDGPAAADDHAHSRVSVTITAARCPSRESVGNEATCAICIDDFSEGDKLRRLPRCGHRFHVCCIDSWLLQNHVTCPVCRSPVIEQPRPASAAATTTTTTADTSTTASETAFTAGVNSSRPPPPPAALQHTIEIEEQRTERVENAEMDPRRRHRRNVGPSSSMSAIPSDAASVGVDLEMSAPSVIIAAAAAAVQLRLEEEEEEEEGGGGGYSTPRSLEPFYIRNLAMSEQPRYAWRDQSIDRVHKPNAALEDFHVSLFLLFLLVCGETASRSAPLGGDSGHWRMESVPSDLDGSDDEPPADRGQ